MRTKTLVTTFLTIVLISCASANIPIPTETPIHISTPTPSFTTVSLTLTPSATHTATLTSSPTPSATHTATATSTPYPTNTPSPTATPIPVFSLIRPVSDDVPLYHAYGVPVGGDPDGNGHNGYDFGLDSCADLKYSFTATAVGSGKVIVTGGDGDIWIDLGVGRLTDGSVVRLLASYWHGKPLPGIAIGSIVKQGQDVYQSIPCGVNNHPAELELQLVALPADAPRDANAVMDLARKLYKNGEFTHIDPALAGISPK